ncbi:MAG: hypothetical protein UU16_C0022G0033 [Candidatus Woesebacteria bacterium GW2011_GWA2_40_7]|uniref:Large ribosomal subunit protein uL1 n=3 Tax=Candidatus Woeseibacteriota TaxID=1752722 RepID=A0A0G0XX14_9BACT|nr:MAG: hypothetical protein UT17_C0002G0197 [Candidatus Woesebacteria bacterium GW2011_GWB1_39_10]KKR73411.1 MAG: hypothetical protein UU16_C0022G0033 [Candidatus Woesebacteria bacterium GW2011_GWA2_40_7]KKR92452.1 MAG: hypothetical protein UU42_C0001G0056 [Candidatus Woesebacteria bacterium GW2011_GWA1_41_13b]
MGKTKTAFVSETPTSVGAGKNEKKSHLAHKSEEGKVHVAGLKGGQRVKVVEAAPTEEAPIFEEGKAGSLEVSKSGERSRTRVERVRSVKYKDAKKKIEPGKTYAIEAAIKLVKEASYSKFDGTMEAHLVLKKAGISAQVTLPHAAGREKKVEIASDETIEKLKAGKIDFDILIATPAMMPKLVPFARLLGPKGLMPNPKNGTLVTDPKKANSFSAGTVTIKTEKEAPLIHTVVGKNSQKDEEIADNLKAIFKAFGGDKQIVRAFIKSTMSPSVKVEVK